MTRSQLQGCYEVLLEVCQVLVKRLGSKELVRSFEGYLEVVMLSVFLLFGLLWEIQKLEIVKTVRRLAVKRLIEILFCRVFRLLFSYFSAEQFREYDSFVAN